jgi:hypothetical protein
MGVAGFLVPSIARIEDGAPRAIDDGLAEVPAETSA